jgi:hypothetical protein
MKMAEQGEESGAWEAPKKARYDGVLVTAKGAYVYAYPIYNKAGGARYAH